VRGGADDSAWRGVDIRPAAGWITGQVIAVDGGASLMDTVFPFDMQGG
jgi:hypothetical protein